MKRFIILLVMFFVISVNAFGYDWGDCRQAESNTFFYMRDCDTKAEYFKWTTVFTVMTVMGFYAMNSNYNNGDRTSCAVGGFIGGVGLVGLYAVWIQFPVASF